MQLADTRNHFYFQRSNDSPTDEVVKLNVLSFFAHFLFI